jgi:hypothetical protein
MSSRYVRLEDKPHRYRVLETCPVRGVLVDAPGGAVWLPEAVVRGESDHPLAAVAGCFAGDPFWAEVEAHIRRRNRPVRWWEFWR